MRWLKNNITEWLPPLLVLLLAAAVRGAYLAQYAETPLGALAVGTDVREYDAWAREILGGRFWWNQLQIHGPLYPYALAAWYKLTGMNVMAVRGVQLGLDMAALLCVWGAVRLLWDRRTAWVAGLLWALYLPLVYYSAELVSEGLTVFLLSAVLLVWALVAEQHARRVLYVRTLAGLGVAGLLLGAAAIAHPLSLGCGVVFAGFAVWWCWRERGRAHAFLAAALLVVTIPAAIFPVSLHNRALCGELVLVQAHGALNVFIGNNPGASGTPNVRPGPSYEALLARPAAAGAVGEGGASDYYRGQVLLYVAEQPGQWLRLLGRKFLLTWNAAEITSGSDLPQAQALTALMRGPLPRFGWLLPLALAGAWFTRRRRETWPFILAPAAYAAALTFTVTSGRYRLGMVPALIALAAVGALGLWDLGRRRTWRQGWPALAGVALGLAVAWLPVPPPVPNGDAEYAALMAEACWRQGDYRGAEPWLRRGLTLAPEDPAMHHMYATVLSKTGKVDEALEHYRRALAGNPRDVEPRIEMGNYLAGIGRRSDARRELEAAVTQDPNAAHGWYNLGVLAEEDSQPDTALAHYRRALDLEPGLASAHLNLGVLYLRRQDYAAAERHFLRAATLEPQRARPFTCLAALAAETGRWRAAAKAFEQALGLDPQQPDAWLAYAQMRRQQGDAAGAGVIVRRGLAANPGNPELMAAAK